MQNTEAAFGNGMASKLSLLFDLLKREKYRAALTACVMAGVFFGSLTQAVYGDRRIWENAVSLYCANFLASSLLLIAPVTLGFIAAVFLLSLFPLARPLIYPAAVFRGLGIGSLICGAFQYGNLRELCFAVLVLLPYAAVNCALAVYSGEYALGLKESFTRQNEGLAGKLYGHALKMFLSYLAAAVLSCLLFAASCYCFGKYLLI